MRVALGADHAGFPLKGFVRDALERQGHEVLDCGTDSEEPVDFPDIALDNNTAERALRTPVLGRKNYYGAHAEWAAHLAARVWTITATAERNHREPLTFLTAYLNACAEAGGRPPHGTALEQHHPWLPAPTEAATPDNTLPPDHHARDGPAP